MNRKHTNRLESVSPLTLALGEDNRLSTSKFQFLIWTVVVLVTYVLVYIFRALRGHWEAIPGFPANLMGVMGFGSASAAAAKLINVSGPLHVRRIKQQAEDPRFSDLFRQDNGTVDLSKVQVMIWTFIAVAIYIATVISFLFHLPASIDQIVMPDVDKSFLFMMGLGNGVYVANKIADSTSINSLIRQVASNAQDMSFVDPPTLPLGAAQAKFAQPPELSEFTPFEGS